MRVIIWATAICVSLVLSSAAEAAPFMGSTTADRAGLYFVGTYGDFYIYEQSVCAAVTASVDEASNQISFDRYQIVMQPFVATLTDSFPVSLGDNVVVTTTIYFDEVVSAVDDWGPFDLVPEAGGTFAIAWEDLPAAMTTTVTGSYTVEGPTETRSGSFSKELRPYTARPPDRWSLDASGYPDSMRLVGCNTLQWNATYAPYLIDEFVDNVAVEVSMGGRYARFDDLLITRVPEPATLCLLAVGGLVMIRRRCTA